MPERSCRVTITDMDGVQHTVGVRAETLYEAVAKGLVAVREDDWVSEIPSVLNEVRVAACQPPVEHSVPIKKFNEWLRQQGRSPAGMMAREKIRKILGVPNDGR